jgi:hypothetical protein
MVFSRSSITWSFRHNTWHYRCVGEHFLGRRAAPAALSRTPKFRGETAFFISGRAAAL